MKIKKALSDIDGITFRDISNPEGDTGDSVIFFFTGRSEAKKFMKLWTGRKKKITLSPVSPSGVRYLAERDAMDILTGLFYLHFVFPLAGDEMESIFLGLGQGQLHPSSVILKFTPLLIAQDCVRPGEIPGIEFMPIIRVFPCTPENVLVIGDVASRLRPLVRTLPKWKLIMPAIAECSSIFRRWVPPQDWALSSRT